MVHNFFQNKDSLTEMSYICESQPIFASYEYCLIQYFCFILYRFIAFDQMVDRTSTQWKYLDFCRYGTYGSGFSLGFDQKQTHQA